MQTRQMPGWGRRGIYSDALDHHMQTSIAPAWVENRLRKDREGSALFRIRDGLRASELLASPALASSMVCFACLPWLPPAIASCEPVYVHDNGVCDFESSNLLSDCRLRNIQAYKREQRGAWEGAPMQDPSQGDEGRKS
ncbi:hypothetical protein N657DRAFT_646180 [Parathielavia appendiculata]|uniref:Uncharacterized protein n=1 Tax=Parathielavia appendiculata TaxID=2587402 RepID=A0AAN6Z302_9PEZI|nr:hypothetical protein N657DRAFT_646180 [Parathielavia appendiculata]